MSDAQKVRDKIAVNLDFSRTISPSTGQLGNFNYSQQRSFTTVGTRSTNALDDYIRKVQNFAVLCQRSDDFLVLELDIESYALRRKLSQALQNLYADRNVIQTQF